MHPVLVTIGPVLGIHYEISTYRAMYTLAAVITIAITWWLCVRFGMPGRRSLMVVLASAAALPIGARIWHIATNPSIYLADASRIWSLESSGHALFGGIALMSVVGLLATRLARLDPWRVADASAPALGVGIAVMRVGCYSGGCCFGVPASGPTAVLFPPGSPAHLWQIGHDFVGIFQGPVTAHPTQLYELVGALLCGAIAAAILRLHTAPGVAFLAFIGAFAVVRWVNWGLRARPDTLSLPEPAYGFIYAATIALCGVLIAVRIARAKGLGTRS